MNEQIKELAKQAGGEFWQRIESDGVLNKEAYVVFDPPQSLEKFAELIVKECRAIAIQRLAIGTDKYTASHNGALWGVINEIDKHFGVEE